MIRIALPFVVTLFEAMEPLARLPQTDAPRTDVFYLLVNAQLSIQGLLEDSIYAPYLRSSFALGNELLGLLKDQTVKPTEGTISQYELWRIKNRYNDYRIALLSELGALNAFFVTQKGAFDTTTLLNWGEALFPTALGPKVPEAQYDAREAAKCIAYELPTSAAFHVFRVVEAVLRRYHAHITNGAAPPKVRNINVYLKALTTGGDPKILAALKQMTDLHRNPLIHPDAVITLDEAISIAGIGRSAVTAMLAVLPTPAPTTTSFTLASPP